MLPKIDKILYCTDLSKNAVFAFRYAVYLAQKTGADVHILSVLEQLPSDERLTLQSYIYNQSNSVEFLHQRLSFSQAQLQQRLSDFWQSLPVEEQGLAQKVLSCEVVEGNPKQTILEHADTLNCDLIVMGGHEKGWLQALLGSVAREVLKDSRIPTLIVPQPKE
ncbi:universal stress protein [Oceanisphaera avium]|uniref:Universal stress family protein n=1 Tax=Oceanisphaera avium TaxID=1903694 RepID=A0A1Y0CZF5_9GAMM|nr:universal stress protein [Oceanisphaera avium]ART80195.1 universal stress family protein [Oceanisphaera avium]